MRIVITFVACFLMDFAWAIYIKRVSDHQALSSSMWSVAVFMLGAVGVINYTANPWLLIPAAVGCFAGTYLATCRPLTKIMAAVERNMRGTI